MDEQVQSVWAPGAFLSLITTVILCNFTDYGNIAYRKILGGLK